MKIWQALSIASVIAILQLYVNMTYWSPSDSNIIYINKSDPNYLKGMGDEYCEIHKLKEDSCTEGFWGVEAHAKYMSNKGIFDSIDEEVSRELK